MAHDKNAPFVLPRLIVCEGFFDVTFLQALARARALPEFHYRFNNRDGGRGGLTRIGAELAGLVAASNFLDVIEHVLIVADCDENPADNFQEVCNQISLAGCPEVYSIPNAPYVIAGVKPTVNIALLPGPGQVGAVEGMCFEIIARQEPALTKCVEDLAQCSGATAWPASKLAKMKLEAFMASYFRDNPQISLGYAWWKLSEGPLLLTDPAFDQIAATMESYR